MGFEVLGPIHFHNQSCPWRKEIHYVLSDWLLPVKLDSKKLFPPQA